MDNEENNKVEEAAAKYQSSMPPEEYLAWERKQEGRHEYVEGVIVTMTGASREHNRILSNLIINIGTFLDGGHCEILPSDMRVYVKSKESYFYPDATIVCDNPELIDGTDDNLLNPSVVIEILSLSTAALDLGKKIFFYRQIESVKEIITVNSTAMEVGISRRQTDNSWKQETFTTVKDQLFIESINFRILLENIYNRIKFGGG